MKAIRTFAAGRKEILAVRIKIKGRVNRWRRTKYIVGTRGTLPLQTMSERIEQGTAQAVNRKGAVGIRIWLRYKPSFLFKLHSHILTYMRYSRVVKLQRRRKAIILK
jgi:ribosomal protein S3